MQYFVVGEEDVVVGFRYAGIDGTVVNTPEEALQALREVQAIPRIGIVILQDTFSTHLRTELNEIRFTTRRPLIVEIPGPSGRAEGRPPLLEMIQEAVGIKV